MGAAAVGVDGPAERHPRALGHSVDRRPRVDLVEADAERLRCVESAHYRIVASRQARLPPPSLFQATPAHEHMFASGADGSALGELLGRGLARIGDRHQGRLDLGPRGPRGTAAGSAPRRGARDPRRRRSRGRWWRSRRARRWARGSRSSETRSDRSPAWDGRPPRPRGCARPRGRPSSRPRRCGGPCRRPAAPARREAGRRPRGRLARCRVPPSRPRFARSRARRRGCPRRARARTE